jgi:hypothetical protein
MRLKLLGAIVGISIVASIGLSVGPIQEMTQAFAQMSGNMNMNSGSKMQSNSSSSMPQCGPNTSPIPGGSQNATYYVSANYTGKCMIDNSTESMNNPCVVANGIGQSGHCEPVMKGYTVNENTTTPVLPTEEWFHFAGVTLQPKQFLDLVDTTPVFATKGHMAMVIPCDQYGDPKVQLFEGILDGGLNTLEPVTPQYLQHMSDPANGLCVYHFDIGATTKNPDGVTDFAIVNVSNQSIILTERNTSTFSLAEGYLNTMS